MRIFYIVFLLAFIAAIAAFAYYNQDEVTVRFADWSVTASLAAVAGIVYLLGMFSGWSVVGIVRRSANRLAEDYERRQKERR